MFEAIKAIPETIKDWRDNRDLLHQLVAGVSAALVVTALAGEKRPSDSLAAVAQGVGATSVANWFSSNAPPFLAESSLTVQSVALSAIILLLAGMVIMPLWHSRHEDDQEFGYQLLRLPGSPAASTIWVLLLIAAQQGDITSTLQRWGYVAGSVATWTFAGLLGAGVLYWLLSRYGFSELVKRPFWRVAVVAYRAGYGVGATLIALVLAAVALPLSIISWMSALESDHSRKARYEIERELAAKPTGSPVAPSRFL